MEIDKETMGALCSCFIRVHDKKIAELGVSGDVFKEDREIAVEEGLRVVFRCIELDKLEHVK